MDVEQLRLRAQAAVLDGVRDHRPLAEIERAVADCRVRGAYEPDLAMLELVIAALDVAGVSRDSPLDTAGWRERFLPEISFRNKFAEVDRLVYALNTAAAFRTGVRSDVLNDTYGWGGAALLPYATRAAVMTLRALGDETQLSDFHERIAASVRTLEH